MLMSCTGGDIHLQKQILRTRRIPERPDRGHSRHFFSSGDDLCSMPATNYELRRVPARSMSFLFNQLQTPGGGGYKAVARGQSSLASKGAGGHQLRFSGAHSFPYDSLLVTHHSSPNLSPPCPPRLCVPCGRSGPGLFCVSSLVAAVRSFPLSTSKSRATPPELELSP